MRQKMVDGVLVDCADHEEFDAAERDRQGAIAEANRVKAQIKAEIADLDLKRIRPLAEGDTEYLANLNAQIKSLRAQLK